MSTIETIHSLTNSLPNSFHPTIEPSIFNSMYQFFMSNKNLAITFGLVSFGALAAGCVRIIFNGINVFFTNTFLSLKKFAGKVRNCMSYGSNSTQNQGSGSYNNTANDAGGGNNGNDAGGGNNGNNTNLNGIEGNSSGGQGDDENSRDDEYSSGDDEWEEHIIVLHEMMSDLCEFLRNLANLINFPNNQNMNIFNTIEIILLSFERNTRGESSNPNNMFNLFPRYYIENMRNSLEVILERVHSAYLFVNRIEIGRNPLHNLIGVRLAGILRRLRIILEQLDRYLGN